MAVFMVGCLRSVLVVRSCWGVGVMRMLGVVKLLEDCCEAPHVAFFRKRKGREEVV
jgi:hypothetical protein